MRILKFKELIALCREGTSQWHNECTSSYVSSLCDYGLIYTPIIADTAHNKYLICKLGYGDRYPCRYLLFCGNKITNEIICLKLEDTNVLKRDDNNIEIQIPPSEGDLFLTYFRKNKVKSFSIDRNKIEDIPFLKVNEVKNVEAASMSSYDFQIDGNHNTNDLLRIIFKNYFEISANNKIYQESSKHLIIRNDYYDEYKTAKLFKKAYSGFSLHEDGNSKDGATKLTISYFFDDKEIIIELSSWGWSSSIEPEVICTNSVRKTGISKLLSSNPYLSKTEHPKFSLF